MTRDVTYDDDSNQIPTCNKFNASLPQYRVTCKSDEHGCLKGWLTQVSSVGKDRILSFRGRSRVTHIAKKLVGSRATSFSHPFYLVIHENAKKVEKKYHLGVKGCQCFLCSSFTTETRHF